jgi:hypothetical protein
VRVHFCDGVVVSRGSSLRGHYIKSDPVSEALIRDLPLENMPSLPSVETLQGDGKGVEYADGDVLFAVGRRCCTGTGERSTRRRTGV